MTSRLVRFALLIIIAVSSIPAYAGEIRERLSAPPAFTLTSAKQPLSLEFCIGDAISHLGSVAALNDGANRVIVTASAPSGKVLVAIDLTAMGTDTQVTGHVYFPRWNDSMRASLASCL